MDNQSIIIIPLHRCEPNKDETASFEQCCKVLGKHPICIVTHNEVDMSLYKQLSAHFGIQLIIEYFDSMFFASINGYNQLMLNKEFYLRFAHYKYILIYQLDAWVFRDELDFWCQQGYDYIGAPWIEHDENGVLKFDGVGNGGFSLRRIQHFIDVLSYKGPVKSGKQLQLKPTLKNTIYRWFYSLGYQNTIEYYKKDPTLYEDIFLSIFLQNTKLRAKIPEPETALLFAFEKQPSYLYSKIGHLPFGCHAWRKYEYDSFWSQHIQ